MRTHFYNKTIRSYIVAFASIFDDLKLTTQDGGMTTVPLHYTSRDKFLALLAANLNYVESTDIEITLPRMAFEMSSLNFAPERHLSPMALISNQANTVMMRNRVPYDFSFSLYLATSTMDDALEIIEQILPFFTPEFTLTINELTDPVLEVNLPVVLNSVSFNTDYEGSFEDKKRVEWTLQFTLKGYLYPNPQLAVQIKKAVVNLNDATTLAKMARYTSAVTPVNALKTEPHVIVDTTIEMPND